MINGDNEGLMVQENVRIPLWVILLCTKHVVFVYVYGPLGAAIATSLSYMLIWILRLYKVTCRMKLNIMLVRDVLSYIVLYIQATLLVFYSYEWQGYVIQIEMVALVLVLYYRDLRTLFKKILARIKR